MTNKEKKYKHLGIIISIVLPLAVALLFRVELKGYNFSYLPPIYATINGITAIVLTCAYFAIKKRKKKLHQNLIANTHLIFFYNLLLTIQQN